MFSGSIVVVGERHLIMMHGALCSTLMQLYVMYFLVCRVRSPHVAAAYKSDTLVSEALLPARCRERCVTTCTGLVDGRVSVHVL